MEISLDFGGSTVDMVSWDGDETSSVSSGEKGDEKWGNGALGVKLRTADKIYVTGGKSRFFDDATFGVPIIKVSEIDAIGYGGEYLDCKTQTAESRLVVVSMGTGTCMVSSQKSVGNSEKEEASSDAICGRLVITHIGGTGVGGGTFVGLGKELLGISDIDKLLEIGSRGSSGVVDIAVSDIVGGNIGRVSGDATASNFGKLAGEVDFKKEDLAAGIINLIGQTIGASAAFAAKAEGADRVVLIGKLTRATAIVDVICGILHSFDIECAIPKNAPYAVAIGARIAYNSSC